jgi:hypothetical protein
MDYKDQNIPDRQAFVNWLPLQVQEAIYNDTKQFLFAQDKKEIIQKLCSNTDSFLRIRNLLARCSFFRGFVHSSYTAISDVINWKLFTRAYEESQRNNDTYTGLTINAFTYGQEHPWEFLPEAPALLSDAGNKESIHAWSDKQREKAGERSADISVTQQMQHDLRRINQMDSAAWLEYSSDRNAYGHSKLDYIIEYTYDALIANNLYIDNYPEEAIDTVLGLCLMFQINPTSYLK